MPDQMKPGGAEPVGLMEGEESSVMQSSETRTKQGKKGNKMNKMMNASAVSVDHTRHDNSLGEVGFEHLGKSLAARLEEGVPTQDSLAQAERCLRELQSVMARLGLDWKVIPYGSFVNGFGTVSSDIDVTCCQPGEKAGGDAQRKAVEALGNWIVPMIQLHGSFSIVEEILGARIPILKLRFENTLNVDVSCHNQKPVMNTRLFKAYSKMDPRIKELGIAIKLWARGVGICDATKKNLSSYSFTLMVIYFLQVHPDVELPVLPVDAFEEGGLREHDERVMDAMASWNCRLTLLEIMSRFFAFYADAFVWGNEVVSVRCGRRHMAPDPCFGKLRGRHTWRLHIEDPFELERNLHCVLGEVEEEQLRSAFTEACGDMQAIVCQPLCSRPQHPSRMSGRMWQLRRALHISSYLRSQQRTTTWSI